ncbi:MAG: hypothetical protein HY928_04370 [Elusimicrobia bacterium]|nr:hypothetical protein [Elusimicrobiota bacterium]
MGPEGETLVGTGAFTVDRARALEKLMRFALPEAAFGALLLIRCAAASGATSLSIRRGSGGVLTVAFDGEPFTPEELANPYEPLFKRQGGNTRRGRELATALLTLLRLDPVEVWVRSGPAGQRARLRVCRGEPETVTRIDDSAGGTSVRFSPGPRTPGGAWGAAFEESLKRSAQMTEIPLFLDGERLPHGHPEGWEEDGASVDGEGLRGWISIPPRCDEASSVEFYKLGVLIGSTTLQLSTSGVVGRVNCDDFRLNASQTSVVRDERFRKAVAALNAAARRMASDAAARQARRAQTAARLLTSPKLRAVWVREIEAFLSLRRGTFLTALGRFFSEPAGVDRTLEAELQVDARRAAWLRETAARARKSKEPDAAAQAPTFLGADGRLISYAQLATTAAGLGHLPFSPGLRERVRLAYPVLWLATDLERASLSRLFPGVPLSDATEALERAHRFGETDRDVSPTLETLGVNGVLTRAPLQAPLAGEAGLAAHLPEKAALSLFADGQLTRSVPLDLPLRFSAVCIDPGPLLGKKALDALAAWCETLYEDLSRDFSADDADPDAASRRAHLFDAVAFWGNRPGKRTPPWLESLPLFPCDAGLLDYKALRARLAQGDTLFFMRRRARLAAPTLSFRDPCFDDAALAAMFPEAEVQAVPGLPDLRAAWKRAEPLATPPAGPLDEAARLSLLEDVLRRRGALPGLSADPVRRFVLESVLRLFTPWLGADPPPGRWLRVREHLAVVPFFARPRGGALSLSQADARLAGSRPLTWTEEPGGAGDSLLDAYERALAAALWPGAAVRPAAANQRRAAKTRAARSGDPSVAAPALPGALFSAPVAGSGLKGTVSLAAEPLPGVTLVLTGRGDPVETTLPTPGFNAAGVMHLDASSWSGPLRSGAGPSASLSQAAGELYRRFLDALFSAWPSLAGEPGADALRAYLLLFAAERPDPGGAWSPARSKLAELPLFPTLGGGTASLAELARRGKQSGRILYAKGPVESCAAHDSAVPVIRLLRLAGAVLDAPLVPYDDPRQAPAPASGEPMRDALEALLAAMRGRKGLDPSVIPDPGKVALREGDGRSLVVREGAEWVIDSKHPAVKLIVSSFGEGALCAPLLASLIASAANRQSRRATDAHDALFQSLLAHALDASALPD